LPKITKEEILERLVEWSGLLDETAMWRPCAGLNGEKSDDDILGEIRALLTAPPDRDDDAMREGVRDEKVKRLIEMVHKVLVLVDNSEDLRGGTYYPWPALRSALAEVDAEVTKREVEKS
jgi:hypothetical protein